MSLTLGWIHPFLVSLLVLSTFPDSFLTLTFPLHLGTFFRTYSPSTTPVSSLYASTPSIHSTLSPSTHPLYSFSLFTPSFLPPQAPLPVTTTLDSFSAIQYSIHSCHPIRPPLYSSHIIFSTPLPPPLPAQFSSPPSPRPCLQ